MLAGKPVAWRVTSATASLGTQLGAWGPSFVKWVSKCCEAYVK